MPGSNSGGLSRRQRECIEARRQRMTAKEAGRALDISPHTVAMHWRLARLKLEAERHLDSRAAMDCAAPDGQQDKAERLDWLTIVGVAALGIGGWCVLLTLIGWMVLLFSPYFAHLRH